ncbi:MAG: class I mannose-6-phosphate isomerase [Anaerolineaceae bacterium]|nr:class I mannose-6-phosphate isomerase [Anaerolineaceae bacterium]
MGILKLKGACKDYIWGGTRLITEYNKTFSGERLAETWELSCHPDGLSEIIDGPCAGETLKTYIETEGKQILGSSCRDFSEFPILVKLIDAKRDLSIQVHPDDAYALAHEGQYGKTEMWYVLDAGPEASLYHGFKKSISRREFRRHIDDGTLPEVLNAVPVKKGDVFFIPAGTVHAVGKDILLAEIQQSSNVTYRVFDYNRPGPDGKLRPLHIEQAVECACCEPPAEPYDFGGHLARCGYFTVDVMDSSQESVCGEESFVHILVIEGTGKIICNTCETDLRKGDSLFLPAGSGKFSFAGDVKALITRAGAIQ